MGGCASKPRDLDCSPPSSLPNEKPSRSSSTHEPLVTNLNEKTTAKEDSNGGEVQKEEPLVDLSEPTNPEPKQDGNESTDSNNPILELVSAIDVPVVADQVSGNGTEEESVVDGNETMKEIKDGEKDAETEGKTEETHKLNVADDKQQLSGSLDSEEKTDTPLPSA